MLNLTKVISTYAVVTLHRILTNEPNDGNVFWPTACPLVGDEILTSDERHTLAASLTGAGGLSCLNEIEVVGSSMGITQASRSLQHQDRSIRLATRIRRGGVHFTAKSCHEPGTPLSSCSPRSSNSTPEPATRSFTIADTRMSCSVANPAIRAAMCTANPPRSSPRISHSPVCMPRRTCTPRS